MQRMILCSQSQAHIAFSLIQASAAAWLPVCWGLEAENTGAHLSKMCVEDWKSRLALRHPSILLRAGVVRKNELVSGLHRIRIE
jgi:hypothetical protein